MKKARSTRMLLGLNHLEPMEGSMMASKLSIAKSRIGRVGSPLERFWAKVDKSPGHGPKGECWIWKAGTNGIYGKFSSGSRSNNERDYAHRWSYRFAYGDILPGLQVLHRCDTPLCVRPDHLFIGTVVDNMDDMKAKGRHRYGVLRNEEHGSTKFPNSVIEQARVLHLKGQSAKLICQTLGISLGYIYAILRGDNR